MHNTYHHLTIMNSCMHLNCEKGLLPTRMRKTWLN